MKALSECGVGIALCVIIPRQTDAQENVVVVANLDRKGNSRWAIIQREFFYQGSFLFAVTIWCTLSRSFYFLVVFRDAWEMTWEMMSPRSVVALPSWKIDAHRDWIGFPRLPGGFTARCVDVWTKRDFWVESKGLLRFSWIWCVKSLTTLFIFCNVSYNKTRIVVLRQYIYFLAFWFGSNNQMKRKLGCFRSMMMIKNVNILRKLKSSMVITQRFPRNRKRGMYEISYCFISQSYLIRAGIRNLKVSRKLRTFKT